MDITLYQSALIPVIVGLVAVARKLGVPTRFLPLASVILGVAGVFLTNGQNPEILAGVVAGLSASGLYSGTKAVIE